jgi:hypothetical protein
MNKPESLRKALSDGIEYLGKNPDKLHIFVDEGAVVSSLAPTISFEYQYTLNLVITDFSADQNLLNAVILYWLRRNQPDIMANPDGRDKGFTFEVDILNNTTCDISINLKLTERVIVKEASGQQMVVEAVPEPEPPYADQWAPNE